MFDAWSLMSGILGFEITNKIIQQYEKSLFYNVAKDYAQSVKKQLLVLDDLPEDSLTALPYNDKEFGAIFSSRLPKENIEKITSEIARVSDKAWIVYPESSVFISLIRPGYKWIMISSNSKMSGKKTLSNKLGKNKEVKAVAAYHKEELGAIGEKVQEFGISIVRGLGMGLGIIGAHTLVKFLFSQQKNPIQIGEGSKLIRVY